MQGDQAYAAFQANRLEKQCQQFYDRLPKLQLKKFSTIKKQQKIKASNKETILKADNRLFGQMILVASTRNLNMQQVLQYPLGPLPWSLANCDGTMKKNPKAVLSRKLEARVSPADVVDWPSASIIDGMSIVQKTHGENHTFAELAKMVLASCLHAGSNSERVDIVFDTYREKSIKNAERSKRGSYQGVVFNVIMPAHTIKNWRRLLSCSASKTKLLNFLVETWKMADTRKHLGERLLYVTCEKKCIKITKDNVEEVEELHTTQEEADTRMLLHSKHASEAYGAVIIVAEDTDVLVLCLAYCHNISTKMYIKCGIQTRMRIIDVTKLGASLNPSVCKALLGLHAFTGCDTVSAFMGHGKVAGLKLLETNSTFQDTFSSLGSEAALDEELFSKLEEFTCKLYAARVQTLDVNMLRYHIF